MNLCNIGVVIIIFHPNAILLDSKLKRLGNDVAIVVVLPIMEEYCKHTLCRLF